MSEDITFCYHLKCKNTKCERHASNITQHYVPNITQHYVPNITQHYVPHSFAFFKDCEHWDLPEKYFTTSKGERKE